MQNEARLGGKVALVTGGARGIGEGIVRCFAKHGARVALLDTNAQLGEEVARSLGEAGAFFEHDVRDVDRWSEVIDGVMQRFGKLDILVNNAGVGWVGHTDREPLAEHERIIGINLTGVWAGVRAAVPAMAASGGGSIVNMSSIDGVVGVAGLTSYVASKFAVTGMTRALALELGGKHIRVNSVHPGVIETPLLGGSGGGPRLSAALSQQPIPRLGRIDEIANAVLFFASDESSYCTGAALVVDGGHTAGPYRVPLPD